MCNFSCTNNFPPQSLDPLPPFKSASEDVPYFDEETLLAKSLLESKAEMASGHWPLTNIKEGFFNFLKLGLILYRKLSIRQRCQILCNQIDQKLSKEPESKSDLSD